jgi:protein-disulfide isomerase
VSTGLSRIRLLAFAVSLTAVGCHAQAPAAGSEPKLSADLTRRVEVMIRSHSEIPADYAMTVTGRQKSEVPGFEQITVVFASKSNSSRPVNFLLSDDGKTLAQFNKYDLSKDPKEKVSGAGRPSRGGPENAPVLIVGFDDLECPFCAKMHAQLFPALVQRYGDQVHIVYRDFPLSQHPWAVHAAVDANCLASTSPAGYWSYVDYVHAHASEFGGDDHSLAKAQTSLDKIATDEGAKQKVNAGQLEACIKKQDDTQVKASMKEGEQLGVDATPALFINGERIDGAQPLEYVYRIIDQALVAAGKTPPPPYQPPVAEPATGAQKDAAPGAPPAKPGT